MLPNPPNIKIEVLENEELGGDGFLYVNRSKVIFHYPNKESSKAFTVDSVGRRKKNAVAIVPFRVLDPNAGLKGTIIYLRSAIRPAIALACDAESDSSDFMEAVEVVEKTDENKIYPYGNLWEIPAGLVEKDEIPVDTAQRELFEELGFDVEMHQIKQLGKHSFPTVGICGETLSFYSANVSNLAQVVPTLDGSPMEEGAAIYSITLEEALEAVQRGLIEDMKTELGIRRLIDRDFIFGVNKLT